MSDYDNGYDPEAEKAYTQFLYEKAEKDRPLKEAPLTYELLRSYSFYQFELENLEGNYIEEYGKTNNEINLELSEWAVNDLFKTCTPLPGIDPRTGAYGPIVAAMGFTNAGCAYSDIGHYRKAISNFTKAIEINPRCILAYLGKGAARCRIGEYKQAAFEDLSDAIELNPLRLAEKNEQSRSMVETITSDNLNELTLFLIECLNARGAAYHRMKHCLSEAIGDFTEAIKYNPDSYKLYLHRAAANKESRLYDDAAADYTSALGLNPDCYQIYALRADAYIKQDKYREAIADYDKMLSMDCGTASEYISRALCYARLNDKKSAVRDAEKAMKMAPNDDEISSIRDGIYREIEEYEKAKSKAQ
ncbi:MAG: tetratricopeptide repeat protein [Treponema sp.]|nr:tetratricopeptide repeat protein [Treponema sp.]